MAVVRAVEEGSRGSEPQQGMREGCTFCLGREAPSTDLFRFTLLLPSALVLGPTPS